MLQKFLQKHIQLINTPTKITGKLKHIMSNLTRDRNGRIQVEGVTKVSRQLINIAEALHPKQQQKQIQHLLKMVRDLTLEIHSVDIYQLYLIRIRSFLLSIKLNPTSDKQKLEKKHKIRLFLQTLSSSTFYPLLQQDFYSSLQKVYLEAVKVDLSQGKPLEAIKSIKQALDTMKKQLAILSEFGGSSMSDKMSEVMQDKRTTLQQLFYLEHGGRFCSSTAASDQIINEILPKYEKLFKKTSLQFNSEQLISKTTKTIKSIEPARQTTTVRHDQIIQEEQSNFSQSRKSCRSSLTCNIISNNNLQHLQSSLNFIEQIKNKRSDSILAELKPKFADISPQLTNQKTKMQAKHSSEHNFQIKKRCVTHVQSRFNDISLVRKNSLQKLSQARLSRNNIKSVLSKAEERKTKKLLQFQTRKFNLLIRQQQQQKQNIISLNLWNTKESKVKLATTQTQMLKNGIFIAGCTH